MISMLESFVVPSPPPDCAFRVYVLSIRVRNRFLLLRLLNDWKSADSRMSVTPAVAPFACLSRYIRTRTTSPPVRFAAARSLT